MNGVKKILGILMILLMVIIPQVESFAKLRNIESNNVFHQDKIPVGKTGKMMSVTFYVETGSDYADAWAGIAYDDEEDEIKEDLLDCFERMKDFYKEILEADGNVLVTIY